MKQEKFQQAASQEIQQGHKTNVCSELLQDLNVNESFVQSEEEINYKHDKLFKYCTKIQELNREGCIATEAVIPEGFVGTYYIMKSTQFVEWLGKKVYVYTDTRLHQFYLYVCGASLLVWNRTIKS